MARRAMRKQIQQHESEANEMSKDKNMLRQAATFKQRSASKDTSILQEQRSE